MDFSGFSYPQPLPASFELAPDTSKIYLHSGENKEDFEAAVKFINYFQEMFKFLPDWEINGYKTGSEGDLTKYEDGFGKYSDPSYRGLTSSGKIETGYDERYGDWHHTAQGYSSGKNPNYWGYGFGDTASNLSWNPSAGETNLFSDIAVDDSDDPIDYEEYGKLMAQHSGDEKKFHQITSAELASARSFIKGVAGNNSFYKFILKGIDKITFKDNNNDGAFSLDGDGGQGKGYDDSNCNFMWKNSADADGVKGKGAYYLMLNLLESRRRIFYAASNVFGKKSNITNNAEMLKDISNFYDNTVKGANANNLSIFYMYFAMQHSFRSILLGMSANESVNGDYGGPGFIYSARDRAGLHSFSDWMSDNMGSYINNIKDKNEKARVQSLYDEYTFANGTSSGNIYSNTYQPYSMTASSTKTHKDGDYVGWDSFYGSFDYKDSSKIPSGLNPYALTKLTDHYEYAISQITGLSDHVITGDEKLVVDGKNYNLYGTNWVVNLVGRYLKYKNKSMETISAAMSRNLIDSNRYRLQKKEYEQKKAEYQEKKYEEETEDAKAAARAAGKAMQRRKEAEAAAQKQHKVIQRISNKASEQKHSVKNTVNKRK